MVGSNVKGRNKILIMSCILLAACIIHVVIGVMYYESIGMIEIFIILGQNILIGYMCYNVYLGKKWAWLGMVGLLKIAIAISFLAILIGVLNINFAKIGLVFIILYTISLYLLLSRDTKLYCEEHIKS